MLDTNAGGVESKLLKELYIGWDTKKIIMAAIIFFLPMGPLLLLAYISVKQLIRKHDANKTRQIGSPTKPY